VLGSVCYHVLIAKTGEDCSDLLPRFDEHPLNDDPDCMIDISVPWNDLGSCLVRLNRHWVDKQIDLFGWEGVEHTGLIKRYTNRVLIDDLLQIVPKCFSQLVSRDAKDLDRPLRYHRCRSRAVVEESLLSKKVTTHQFSYFLPTLESLDLTFLYDVE
jgi:hypothetical protein